MNTSYANAEDYAAYKKEVDELLYQTCFDTAAFAQSFMGERFTREFDPPYKDMFDLIDNEEYRQVAIAAPRGTGKTSLATLALPARRICFEESKYIMILSCTHTMAAENVDNLASELTENENLVDVFGNLRGPRWSLGNGVIQTKNGIHVVAKGAGQQIRGMLKKTRPDVIIIDDLEDSEPFRIGDPTEYLRKLKEWFYADLMNSIDHDVTRVICVGTILGEQSLLSDLLANPDWHSTRLELCDENYKSNFPNRMSDAQVGRLVQKFINAGQLDLFHREYRNVSIAPEDAVFKRESFRYFYPEDVKDRLLEKFIIVDPAKTVKTTSAETAIICVGFDHGRGIYFIDCVNERLDPKDIYEKTYEMAVRNRARTIAVEVTSLNSFITHPFNDFLACRGYPNVVELNAVGKKIDRIKALAPYYLRGLIFHNPSVAKHLEEQLLSYPRSRLWDVMDAFAYTIQLFARGFMFVNPSEDEEIPADELAELEKLNDSEYEPVYNWGVAP